MKKLLLIMSIAVFAVHITAQTDKKTMPAEKEKNANKTKAGAISKTQTPVELAQATALVYGGEKFKNMKTLVVRGTADVSGSPTMTFPATFATIYAGDKYRLEISNPFQPFKQIYDGEQTFSSINGFSLPPINRLGLPLLQHIGEKDFTVAALPEKNKGKTGFRITSPEGYYTDFFTDDKTGLIKGYESSYDINGRTVTTSVQIDKVREVEGIKVPERYAQRLETGQLTVYVDFKAKEILVNSTVANDIFVMSK